MGIAAVKLDRGIHVMHLFYRVDRAVGRIVWTAFRIAFASIGGAFGGERSAVPTANGFLFECGREGRFGVYDLRRRFG